MKDNIGKEFMRMTTHSHLSPSDEKSDVPQPPLELPIPEDARQIPLPAPELLKNSNLELCKALDLRRSIRAYSDQPLKLAELSFLLWYTQGVQKKMDRPATLRPVPSAGARHALETYLLINRVEGIEPGLYRFAALAHSLVEMDLSPELCKSIHKTCRSSQPLCESSAVTFIWVAVSERMTWRYSERGFRFLHLDAGHVCQNLYLAAEVISSGVCAIGGYNDDDINSLLGMDGENHFVIYIAAVGKKGDIGINA